MRIIRYLHHDKRLAWDRIVRIFFTVGIFFGFYFGLYEHMEQAQPQKQEMPQAAPVSSQH